MFVNSYSFFALPFYQQFWWRHFLGLCKIRGNLIAARWKPTFFVSFKSLSHFHESPNNGRLGERNRKKWLEWFFFATQNSPSGRQNTHLYNLLVISLTKRKIKISGFWTYMVLCICGTRFLFYRKEFLVVVSGCFSSIFLFFERLNLKEAVTKNICSKKS